MGFCKEIANKINQKETMRVLTYSGENLNCNLNK